MPRFSGTTPSGLGGRSRRLGGGATKMSSKNNPKKITIKPFSKPPQLPPNFYETTSKQLLEATQAVFLQHQNLNSSSSSSTTISMPSQQNSYTSVVDLVNHQYGTRLYQDLKTSMKQAAKQILGDVSKNSTTLLAEIQQKYTVYVDYVLLCRHVFLHLDQTHIWQNGTVVKRSGVGGGSVGGGMSATVAASTAATGISTTPTNTAQSSSGTSSPQSVVTNGLNMYTSSTPTPITHSTLWDIGLAQFKERLLELKLDQVLFQNFWDDLWKDWSSDSAITTSSSSTTTTTIATLTDRFLLGKIIKMWQDLGMLPQILIDLQSQLQQHLNQVSLEWRSHSIYTPISFLRFIHEKWWHVSTKWTFLPRSWLRTLVEMRLLKPHMTDQYLFKDIHFDAIVDEEDHTEDDANSRTKQIPSSSTFPATTPGRSLMAQSQAQQQQQQQHFSSISTLWMLAARIHNGLPQVTNAICNYVRRKGLALVKPHAALSSSTATATTTTTSAPSSREVLKTMIPQLLNLYTKLDRLVHKLHMGTSELLPPLKNVWDDIVNDNQSVAEYLAKHVDSQFRNTKLQNANEFQERVLQLFCHLQAKDIFEAFYKRDLAKRLLLGKVVSMDMERSMVTLLKAECGAGYTSKMEGMFQDVEWSHETMARYKQSQQQQPSVMGSIDMEVQVLTTGYWPVYPQYQGLILPKSLEEQQEKFWNHYKTKYQGRRMTWQYALGNCSVKATFGSKKYELVVSLCQALVLLCFNDVAPEGTSSSATAVGWTLPQIMSKTGLDDRAECERLLQSLSLGKDGTRVLRKCDYIDTDAVPAATQTGSLEKKKKKPRLPVWDKDTFVINEKFESRMRKIKINNIQWKESKEERDKMVEGVSRDRLYLIDAVLVRIMKARKTILHQQLIPQVLEQVKVPAQPSDIKKRIESLIERDYMERDTNDRNRYKYLA